MSGRPREFDDAAVIDAAMDVFWTHGYEGTSAQALVECTGLGRGSLYNAFGSKLNLYHEALTRYQTLGLQTQADILNAPGPVKERLRALMQWGIDEDLNPDKQRGCMSLFAALERGAKDPKVRQISQAYLTRIEQVIVHLIAVGQRNGELSAERSPLLVARTFLSTYYGLRALGRTVSDRAFLEDIVEGTLAQL
ncbi:TetR/AcrR family transcriptional regulator [Pandoraea nosoerga]|uniref:TetR family transcriptional regulator n=1 Tax=Pandoraea nosoerga TaxID=2508296 RepID=A0A5E4T4Q6_9BURK|nr:MULTISPECIES: TetR/AcrR family transcriptional regulator [Pandoraea]MBN4664272.1 TetR/AcrR family transcriptional regulator [Pandoraea nosoerga]MBN4675833.1 TetR/AcrR family transcriptional regulator [Pandoraea nosoerga]MBN4679360.1 TetR/AcrR family transcriptional regulator [Pandoraea nosoerga]MBN4743643.1 TetR/AcrR family transcriptional regulator [Pandoraea nosoerga]VVD82917.1 TetR family transcriptional regulator [Pandoraea nosoerga]